MPGKEAMPLLRKMDTVKAQRYVPLSGIKKPDPEARTDPAVRLGQQLCILYQIIIRDPFTPAQGRRRDEDASGRILCGQELLHPVCDGLRAFSAEQIVGSQHHKDQVGALREDHVPQGYSAAAQTVVLNLSAGQLPYPFWPWHVIAVTEKAAGIVTEGVGVAITKYDHKNASDRKSPALPGFAQF